jgi:protein-tyrosine phosphatase
VEAADLAEAMVAINREFVLDHAAIYARLLKLILEADQSVLIHCAAGKDRTGFGAAVILSALDVSEEVIMRDYVLTTDYFLVSQEIEKLAKRHSLQLRPEVIAPVFEARPEYLQSAFDSIRREYGDVNRYLAEALGFDASAKAELKARLLI